MKEPVHMKQSFSYYKMNKFIGSLFLLIILSSFAYGRSDIRVVNLHCDNMKTPILVGIHNFDGNYHQIKEERNNLPIAFLCLIILNN